MTEIIQAESRDWKAGNSVNLAIGDWFWVKDREGDWLGCVTELGTNYAKLKTIYGGSLRIHLDIFDSVTRPEPNWKAVVAENVQKQRSLIAQKLEEIRRLTHDLGVGPKQAIAGAQAETSNALCVVHEKDDRVGKYKKDLILAESKTLPALHDEIKKASTELSAWLVAETLSMSGLSDEIHKTLKSVKNRIFSVELYAGLTETVVQIKEGNPADISEKLHVMQRCCYMDEECIAGYTIGGIDCKSITVFDKWLARKANFERLLPYPRTIVAFQVRRKTKYRHWDGSLLGAYIKFRLEERDHTTFLYIRNGQQLHRLSTAIDFGSKLFPDREELDLSKKMWVRRFGRSIDIDNVMSDDAYRALVKEDKEKIKLHKKWCKDNPKKSTVFSPCGMFPSARSREYEPFDQSSVYFDDIAKEISERANSYNRIALIIQGLYDRSMVLHPHPPVKLWDGTSFAASVELVYDALTLHAGVAPDFEHYRAACNQSLKAGCVTIGQEDYWLRREAERENEKRKRNWRYNSHDYEVEIFQPYGNDGPGLLAVVQEWKAKTNKAVYRWEKRRQRYGYYKTDTLPTSVTVPAAVLLNIDAYKPGDFKQFYVDYRTRVEYLKWAPLLLAAEEYHAGNLKCAGKKTKRERKRWKD